MRGRRDQKVHQSFHHSARSRGISSAVLPVSRSRQFPDAGDQGFQVDTAVAVDLDGDGDAGFGEVSHVAAVTRPEEEQLA